MNVQGSSGTGARRWWSVWAALAACGWLASCADPRVAGGNSSGTSNTLTGRLVDSSGAGVANLHVVARGLLWSAEDSGTSRSLVREGRTDSIGRFEIDSVPSGAWVVEASGERSGYLFAPVVAGGISSELDLGTGIPGACAALLGRLHGDSSAATFAGSVRLAGTNHVASLDSLGRFRMAGVPPGTGRMVGAALSGGRILRAQSDVTIPRAGSRDSIFLTASAEGVEDYSTWSGMKTATVDLLSTSSSLNSDQHEVPILVRLDASILPQWDLDGASIRFSSEHGKHLPFEIEDWNPALRQARIWVRVDTLNHGSNKHYLNLHWGKTGVPSRSDAASVFDSTQGWTGVWHFAAGSPWKNATGRIPTFGAGSSGTLPAIGGIGLVFGSTSGMVLSDPSLATSAGVSIVAFLKIDSVSVDRAWLVRQGAEDSTTFDWALSLHDSSGTLQASFATRLQPFAPAPPKTTGPVPRSAWTLVGGVFDTAARRSRLELPDDSNRWTTPYDTLHLRNPAPQLVVGGGFSGTIDELRVMRIPVHPDFIRAQWLSWNPASGMLKWPR